MKKIVKRLDIMALVLMTIVSILTSVNTYANEQDGCEHDCTPKINKEATCTEQGETEYICKKCGEVVYIETTEKIAHEYIKEIIIKPTFSTNGKAIEKCEKCGYVKSTIIQREYVYYFILIGGVFFVVVVVFFIDKPFNS